MAELEVHIKEIEYLPSARVCSKVLTHLIPQQLYLRNYFTVELVALVKLIIYEGIGNYFYYS